MDCPLVEVADQGQLQAVVAEAAVPRHQQGHADGSRGQEEEEEEEAGLVHRRLVEGGAEALADEVAEAVAHHHRYHHHHHWQVEW